MPFFYVDWYYIVLVLPAVILSLWASAHVKSTCFLDRIGKGDFCAFRCILLDKTQLQI